MVDGDCDAEFGPSTRAAVEAFQRRRGLRIDGIVGSLTWETLVEAGRVLGDRVLARTSPATRGDDVAELQERLAALGFDPGRVDGIFGDLTRAAVAGFQRDCGLDVDGVAGGRTLDELRRVARHPHRALVSEVKERSGLRATPRALSGLGVAIGQAGGLDAVAVALARALRAKGARVSIAADDDDRRLAAAANVASASCLVVIRLDPGAHVATALYFRSERSHSPSGERLAAALAAGAARALGVEAQTRGMALPVLRESAMTASVVELGPLDRVVERTAQLAEALAGALEAWTAAVPHS